MIMERILGSKAQSSLIFSLFLQFLLVVAAHFDPPLARVSLLLNCLVALATGLVYSVGAQKVALWERAYGGALIAGTAALFAIIASVQYGDMPVEALMIGTLLTAIAGAVGGMIGREWSSAQRA
jgi:hypothetical protein